MVNRIKGIPKINHKPSTGESTRSLLMVDGEKTSSRRNSVVRYYAVPIPEQKDASFEIEVASPNAKVRLPEGSWGYCIVAREVLTNRSGELSFKQKKGYLSKVYIGEEISKTGIDAEISRLKNLESLSKSMADKGLDRAVKVHSGKTIGINDSNVRVIPRY